MKKILALALALMLTALLPACLAEETDAKTLVYANVPDGWAYPCVWAWDDSGATAFAAWPGEQMEPDPANEGWYYLYLPAGMDCVIINANDGGVQTGDCRIDKKNAWLTIAEDATAAVSFEALTQGDAPAYTEYFTVYAKVDESWENPCVWAWQDPEGTNAFAAWPGRSMKQNANGWASARIPAWCNSIILNGNGGAVQTEDIKDLDPADLWLTVMADASFELTYDDPTAPKAEDVTVYAKVPGDWAEPCLWAWSHPDGANAFTAWPGEKLAAGEGGWYTLQVGGWINSIILNANGGSVQTTDIRVEEGKDLYLVVTGSESFELSYEKPAE